MTNTLKELRKKYTLTQKDVAIILGFKSEDRICLWERGQAMPSVENLFRLAKLYDVHPYEIYPGLGKGILE